MTSLSRVFTSRSLVSLMETIISLPNRPDLRCAPHPAARAGADIVTAYPDETLPTSVLPPR